MKPLSILGGAFVIGGLAVTIGRTFMGRSYETSEDTRPNTTVSARRIPTVRVFGKKKKSSKLYFRYGTVGSGKSVDALRVHGQYDPETVFVMKPDVDSRNPGVLWTRFGNHTVPVDGTMHKNSPLPDVPESIRLVIVDEGQFLDEAQVIQLRDLATTVPVMVYGIVSDSNLKPFEGSMFLFTHASEHTMIKGLCKSCSSRSNYNMRLSKDGRPEFGGESVQPGTHYAAVCYPCYMSAKDDAMQAIAALTE